MFYQSFSAVGLNRHLDNLSVGLIAPSETLSLSIQEPPENAVTYLINISTCLPHLEL